MKEAENDVFDILSHIAGLGDGGGISNGERHIKHLCQCAGEESLARASGTEEKDIALLDLHIVEVIHLQQACRGLCEALVVIVHGDREHLFSGVLSDHMLVEQFLNLSGLGNAEGRLVFSRVVFEFLFQDSPANGYAAVANINAGTGDEFADFGLALSAERAHGEIVRARH